MVTRSPALGRMATRMFAALFATPPQVTPLSSAHIDDTLFVFKIE